MIHHVHRRALQRSIALVTIAAFASVAQANPGPAAGKKATGASTNSRPKSSAPKSHLVSPITITKDLTGGRPVLQRGPLTSFSTVPITNAAGTTTISYAQFADKVLKIPRERNARLSAARAGLLADPVIAEEVVDTDESSILLSTTTFTVTDPSIVKGSVPELFRRTPTGVTTAKMNAPQRKTFDAYKAQLASKPAGDPLKIAAAVSDDALISAIAEGKGEQTLTSRVVLEKKVPRVANDALVNKENVAEVVGPGKAKTNTVAKTKRTTKGGLVQGATTTIASPFGPGPYTFGSAADGVEFLAGFTIGDEIRWDWTIDLGLIGDFTVGAVAAYSFGLRVPMKVDSVMTPSIMGNQFNAAGKAVSGDTYNYDVALTASVSDANADYYRRVGVTEADVQDGKELVVLGDVYVFIEGKVLGIPFDGRFPSKPLIDWGSNFTPPFGNCGTACGFDVWVPAALTHTEISILGIVSGSGQLGFNVAGKGTVGVNYESLVADKVVASSLGAAAATNLNAWSSDGVGFVPKLKTDITPVNAVTEKSFGYRITKPTYKWDVVVTPEVKFDVAYDLLLFKDEFSLGPYDVGALAFSLGTVTLNAHAGTTNTFTSTGGQYSETKCTAGLLECGAEGGKDVGVGKDLSGENGATTTRLTKVTSPGISSSIVPTTTVKAGKRRTPKTPVEATTAPAQSPVPATGRVPGTKVGKRERA